MPNNITLENARLLFRNFAGEERAYNDKGRRNFCVVIPEDQIESLRADGWNIKFLPAREEGDEPLAYLQVKVKFGKRPPRIVVISSANRVTIDEETCSMLDWAEFETVDLIIRPYDWEVNGKSGRTAYLKTGFFTLYEDALEKKYAIRNAPSDEENDVE